MNWELVIIIGVVIVGILTFYTLFGNKKTWYRVQLANPEMSEVRVYRTMRDRLWALDAPSFLLFRREDGMIIKINKHWIIKIEVEREIKK